MFFNAINSYLNRQLKRVHKKTDTNKDAIIKKKKIKEHVR